MKSSIKNLKTAIIILAITNTLTIIGLITTFYAQHSGVEMLSTDQNRFETQNLRWELNDLGILPGWSPEHAPPCLDVPAEDCPEVSEEYSRVFILDRIEELNLRLQALESQL